MKHFARPTWVSGRAGRLRSTDGRPGSNASSWCLGWHWAAPYGVGAWQTLVLVLIVPLPGPFGVMSANIYWALAVRQALQVNCLVETSPQSVRRGFLQPILQPRRQVHNEQMHNKPGSPTIELTSNHCPVSCKELGLPKTKKQTNKRNCYPKRWGNTCWCNTVKIRCGPCVSCWMGLEREHQIGHSKWEWWALHYVTLTPGNAISCH